MALLNTYTFLTRKSVYYSVTVGAETQKEAKEIASDPNYYTYCENEDDVYKCQDDEYKVVKLLEKEVD